MQNLESTVQSSLCLLLIAFCIFSLFSCAGQEKAVQSPRKDELRTPTSESAVQETAEEPLRSQNYRFSTPLTRGEEDKIIVRAEAFHAELSKAFLTEVCKRKAATIEIVSDRNAFAAKVSEGKPEIMEGESALFVEDRVILTHLDLDSQGLFHALFRQQTRLYLYDLTRKFPLWIEEGLVSFFEEVTVSGEKYTITGYSADKMEKLQALLASGNYPGFRQLVGLTQRKDFTEKHQIISWGFTYWAQAGGSDANRLMYKKYLRAVLDKGAENVNIENFLNMSLEEFQKKWENWILKQEIYRKGDR